MFQSHAPTFLLSRPTWVWRIAPRLGVLWRFVNELGAGVWQVGRRLALLGVLLSPSVAGADLQQWAYRSFPFSQVLNLDAVYEVTHSSPDRLIETIRRWRVDVRLVRSDTNALPLNPLLAQLPLADPALIREVDFRDTYEGLVIHGGSPHCAPGRSLILIRDTATSYTLIHEFVQSQLRPECAGEPYHSLEVRFGAAFRRLQIYERRLLDDPYRLLDPRWRRDILAAQTDVAQTLYDRIRLGQSQEAIVEKLLSAYIDERNPYFDATRRAQGLRYGEVMIDNAVDLFDAVTNSLAFVEETVRTLLTSVLKGEIAPDRNIDLTDADLALVEERAQVIRAHLAPVQGELQVLKQFYAR